MLNKTMFSAVLAIAAITTSADTMAQNETPTAVFRLDEVVVTARRVEESLQNTPIAVSAFTGEELIARGYDDISDVAFATPNLVFDTSPPISGNPSGAAVFIRGVGQLDFTVNVDPGVGIYVDGVYVSRGIGSTIDLLDVERLEVLRGPQGTLFGRNTIGGAIQLISKAPSDELEGHAELLMGGDSRTRLQAAVNLPLSDNLFSKFTVLSHQRDGYVIDGRSVDLGDDDALSARAQFLWQASDLTEVSLALDFSQDDENGSPNVPIQLFANDGAFGFAGGGSAPTGADDMGTRFNFFAPNCPFNVGDANSNLNCFGPQWQTNSLRATNSTFPLTKSENDVFGAALTISHGLGWADFKSITAFRDLESEFGRDSDHSPYPIFATANLQDQDQFSQEFQLAGDGDNSHWVVGAYYFEEEASEYTQIFLPAAGGPVLLQGTFYNDVDNDSLALFGEYTFDFNPQWSLSLGARYTDETKGYASDQGFILVNNNTAGSAVYAGIDANDPATNPESLASYEVYDRARATNGDPSNGGFVVTLISEPGRELDFTETTKRVSLSYHPDELRMFYLTYADGYKSGGFNPRYLAPTTDLLAITFEPEFVDMIEAGYKYSNVSGTLRANLALFSNSYDDIQISADSPSSNGATVTQNAAEASISGLEGEFTWIPSESFLVQASFGLLDAEYDALGSGVQSTVTLSSELARIPEVTAGLGFSYQYFFDHGGVLTSRLDIAYRSETEGSVQNDPQAFEDDYTVANANFIYLPSNSNWQFTLGISNLSDEEYFHSVNINPRLGYSEAVYARPREYHVSARYNF